MSSSKHQINPNVFVSDIIVNNTSDLQQSIQVSALEEQKTAEESLKGVELTNEAASNGTISTLVVTIVFSSIYVCEVFNFPNGGTKVTVKTRPNTNDPVVKEWRSQFGEDLPKKIFVKDLVAYIKDKKDAGRMFKLNFLVVFFSLTGETMMSNTVNQRFLTSVKITTDVRNLNWGDYMLFKINRRGVE
ncbi:hypothetical protein R6Q57_013795 [Mikania cordata]